MFAQPEILLGQRYDFTADCWSIGVIVYSLLFGVLPFEETTKRRLYTKIIKGKYDLPPKSASSSDISNEGKEFLSNLLVTDTTKRWTMSDALNSSWLNMDAAPLRRYSLVNSQDSLRTFDAKLKVKAAMFAVNFVTQLSSSVRKLDMSVCNIDSIVDDGKISNDGKTDE